jgi:transcriptional regulator with XRE-family HTH domain
MKIYNEVEINLLNIQIGCVLRFARLEKGVSQFSLSLILGTNQTMIGRIERAENFTSWEKIFEFSEYFQLDFGSLFKLKERDNILALIKDSYNLEKKLTEQKKRYYKLLEKTVIENFSQLKRS